MLGAVSRPIASAMRFAFALLAAGVGFGFGGVGAQEQGYWRLSKVLPAEIKPSPPNEAADVVRETRNVYVENTVSTDKGQITTHTYFSSPPLSLFPGQKVTFHASIRRIQNTFGCCFFGTGVDYQFGVSKEPRTTAVMLNGQLNSSDTTNVRDLSGVMKVPDNNYGSASERAEKSLWLAIELNPPRYKKYYQYAWVAGPAPADSKTGDIDLGVPSAQPPSEPSVPSNQPKQAAKACPDNAATQLELQVCRHSAAQGATIRVPIYLLKSDNLANLNLELKYDSAVVKPVGKAEKGPLLGSQVLFESNLGQAGVARLGFAGSGGVSGSGILAYVPFTIVGAPGSRTTVAVHDTAANTAADARPSFALVAGEIAVAQAPAVSEGSSAPKPGPNTSPSPSVPPKPPEPVKVFTALDALKALQMSVNLLTPDMAYDLDKNAQITSNDARLILRRVVER